MWMPTSDGRHVGEVLDEPDQTLRQFEPEQPPAGPLQLAGCTGGPGQQRRSRW